MLQSRAHFSQGFSISAPFQRRRFPINWPLLSSKISHDSTRMTQTSLSWSPISKAIRLRKRLKGSSSSTSSSVRTNKTLPSTLKRWLHRKIARGMAPLWRILQKQGLARARNPSMLAPGMTKTTGGHQTSLMKSRGPLRSHRWVRPLGERRYWGSKGLR